MQIFTENLGKKFKNEWIFRNLSHTFQSNNIYAITGPNGSGKSTLLQVLASFIPQNVGTIQYATRDNSPIAIDQIFRHIAISSPAMELIEEFSLSEIFDFQAKLNKLSVNKAAFIENLALSQHQHKALRYYSSGMRQKVKLGLCLASTANIILLDEPTTNLDLKTKAWYQNELEKHAADKIILIASNDPQEYEQAKEKLDILDFK